MSINEDLYQLSERLELLRSQIKNEESTKMSMILPFFQILGYDVFNPLEFCPEFVADVGVKKGEKVDYAIILNNEPAVLIECKSCQDDLDKHSSQLFRYYSTTPAKFGILTNGLIYKFYTDLDEQNKMDLTPFLEVNLLNLNDTLINEIKKFSKAVFDSSFIFSNASDLKYTNLIKEWLKKQFENPSESFIKLILSDIYPGVKNQKVIDKFSPIIQKTCSIFINEVVNQKITSALIPPEPVVDNIIDETETSVSKIITTQEEIESFFIIRGILAGTVNIENIVYRDTESYFGILYKDNNRKPICRLMLDGKKKQIMIPDESKNFQRFYINSLNDLYQYKEQLISVVNRYLNE